MPSGTRGILVLAGLAAAGGCRFDPAGVGEVDSPPGNVADAVAADGREQSGGADGPVDAAALPPDAWVCPSGALPNHIGELSEGVARWAASYEEPVYGRMPPVVTVRVETVGAQVGDDAIRLDCSTDRCSLVYPADLNAGWDLSGFSVLELEVAAYNPNPTGWQEDGPQVRFYTTPTDYLTATPRINLIPRLGWLSLSVPFESDLAWAVTETGNFDRTHVNALQIRQDTWETSYVFWVDGVVFGPGTFYDCAP